MVTYNLSSPTTISEACCFDDLDKWLARQVREIEDKAIRSIVRQLCRNLSSFVKWPTEVILMWQGCDRIPPKGKKMKYHRYPDRIKVLTKKAGIPNDTRPNGPAIAAYLLAGGERPERRGSNNAWSIHHLYSGKFLYIDRDSTTHAAKEGLHFTQSTGLIAVHPIADAMCDEFPAFAWRLRAESFRRFGYDPDGVFSGRRNKLGFASGSRCRIISRGE